MSVTPSHPEPLPPTARLLQSAFAEWAAEDPDQASELPWAWLRDPTRLAEWRQRDTEAARIRQAIAAGADPEDLGFVHNGLERILKERGLA